ncbi:type I restriction enzyme endonuclease domain-containing protein [Salsuginibacillus kocurii]|uniref:type I restriction enzyme endonuclease domain-containing protein n=1 Tax=Salsuginibacillus kocurii TaxID=427078 RepID=UPI0003AAE7FB|nr:type I restriction enzyme endonuclease domain-containing protein [Salsuginibacillus kocurii]
MTVRYQRGIPELFKYNAFCVISDGVNNRAASLFAPYDFFYAWRKIEGSEPFEKDGIDYEEKAFYDILKAISEKYEFEYPHDKLIKLSQEVKAIIDDKARYTDWSNLIITLAENDYPPAPKDEIFKEIFEQAENFKKYRV